MDTPILHHVRDLEICLNPQPRKWRLSSQSKSSDLEMTFLLLEADSASHRCYA